MIAPAFDLDDQNSYRLRFYGYSSQEPDGAREKMRIMILDEVYDNVEDLHANATLVDELFFTQTWDEYVVDLGEYSGEKIHCL